MAGIRPCCGNELSIKQDVVYRSESNALVSSSYAIVFTPGLGAVFALLWKHRNTGRITTRENIWDELYAIDPDGGPDPKILDVMISKMRKLLKPTDLEIVTVWGRGYFLRAKNANAAPRLDSRSAERAAIS